jgi:GT2 family glycosyltransferase
MTPNGQKRPQENFMLKKLLRLILRAPSHAAVSGGWIPLLRTALSVIRQEGLGSFFIKLNRLLGFPSQVSHSAASVKSVDVQRFSAAEAASVAVALGFQNHANPRVSIIVPVFNQFILTIECLAAIKRHPQMTSFELLLVDDASTDETKTVLPSISGLQYLRNVSNLGYLHSCNSAIQLARGDYVYFLNNDTQVQKDWLDPLVARLDAMPTIGVVGSMLLFPDGRLQEAGARLITPADKNQGELIGELIGLGCATSDPSYQFAREVEYCSGASLMVRRDLLTTMDGLDTRYAPAYFEDADLAYSARRAGYRVYYEPLSEVVHHLSASVSRNSNYKKNLVARNAKAFLNKWDNEITLNRRIRSIAFYLPQYHPIPENDEWWGKGFTEWANVTKAKPNFTDHYQPHVPSELGFYDLRVPEIREEQANLAKEYGVSGFCYYYYWFNGKRLLSRPLDEILSTGQPDFPFCLCWANENWTRTWDGQDSHILIAQDHSLEDDIAFIQGLFPALRDSRYIRIDGKPLILIYKVALLPDAAQTALTWRDQCRAAGIGEIYLACVHNSANPALNANPKVIGLDAAVEFPPSGKGVTKSTPHQLLNVKFRGLCYDYIATIKNFMQAKCPPYVFFRGVMPSWDNTARRQDSGHIFLGSGPEAYAQWLESAAEWTARMHVGDERIVFINAWNEWAEGNHLEPDKKYGRAYLEATRTVMQRYIRGDR